MGKCGIIALPLKEGFFFARRKQAESEGKTGVPAGKTQRRNGDSGETPMGSGNEKEKGQAPPERVAPAFWEGGTLACGQTAGE